uniref:Ribosome production factor 2 homolog n=1 Tax=Hucho hucho TaxID=62062 RepID=A0A4W5N076_9TELE
MKQYGGVIKPKTKRAKRFLDNRAPKLTENIKNAMIMKGGNTSMTVTQALKDIYALKKPSAVLYKKKNITRPFEDSTSLEFFSKKTDSSLFLFGSHNKKRPNNLIFGRLFDFHVLDMIELGIEKYISLSDIKSSKCPEGTKPMLVFAGEAFDHENDHKRLKSLLTDFFRGPVVPSVRLAGLEHVLHFTALEGKIYMRSYRSLLKKSGCRTPRIELEEIGPSFDFILRRTHLASDDLYKTAHRQPKALKVGEMASCSQRLFSRSFNSRYVEWGLLFKRPVLIEMKLQGNRSPHVALCHFYSLQPKKKKNISHDTFGTKFGRLHMQKQDLAKLQTRKMKGLRKRRGPAAAAAAVVEGETSPKTTEVE